MNRLAQGRNPMNVSTAANLSALPVLSEFMKGFTLEKSPTHVRNVAKLSVVPVLFKYMKELTLERNPINVRNVGKPSFPTQVYTHT